jgi:hypothetical protein
MLMMLLSSEPESGLDCFADSFDLRSLYRRTLAEYYLTKGLRLFLHRKGINFE